MIKNKIHKKKYRPCVGIVLIQNGKIFSGQRLDYKSDAWQMPQRYKYKYKTSRIFELEMDD